MVPLEGMAMGVPVIASDCTSLPELVTNKVSGYVFPSGDHQALADVLTKIKKPRLLDLGNRRPQHSPRAFQRRVDDSPDLRPVSRSHLLSRTQAYERNDFAWLQCVQLR